MDDDDDGRWHIPKLPAELPRKGNQGPRSRWSDKLGHEILNRYAAGEALDSICADLHTTRQTLWMWAERMPAFKEAFERARESFADAQIDLAMRIADDSTLDLLDQGDGRRLPNSASVARSKLRSETRFKLAGLVSPQRWGEKTMLTGGDGISSPFSTGGEYDMSRLSADEAATLAVLIAKMRKTPSADDGDADDQDDVAED